MDGELSIGLDVHKNSITATVLDSLGHRVDQSSFEATDAEIIRYLRRFPGPKQVVLEACSVWEHCYDAAGSTGARVLLASPLKTRLISEASLKSDKVDSDALAKLGRLGSVPEAFAPDASTRALRQLVRDRVYYQKLLRSAKNHIYSVLLRKGIPYQDQLLKYPRKREQLRAHGLEEVDRGLTTLIHLEETVKNLDSRVHEAYRQSPEAQLLTTIPGIGELTAMIVVAELCPVDRFPNIGKACAYAGLVPTNHQSGETSYQGHLRQDSNHLLQWALVEAAWAHRRWAARSSDVTRIGTRVARRRGKAKGNTAAAHKLLKIVYAVLRRGTPYTPERPSPGPGIAEP